MKDRLTRIESRLRCATPGPWEMGDDGSCILAPEMCYPSCEYESLMFDDGRTGFKREEDAWFVANAFDDIQWLVSEIKRLRPKSE